MTRSSEGAISPTAPVVQTAPVQTEPHSLKFGPTDKFSRELKRRIDAYFERTGRRRRDCPQMYFKTATILAWFTAVYVVLVAVPMAWWLVVPLAVVLGLATAAIGFNIQHDEAHKAY